MPASERLVRHCLSLPQYSSRLRFIVLIALTFGLEPAAGVGPEGLKVLLRLASGGYKEKWGRLGYDKVDYGDKTFSALAAKPNQGG
jgi:hypothetical protein